MCLFLHFEARAQTLIPFSIARPIVSQVELKGDLKFDEATHWNQIQTRANRNFLSIPGMPLWLWLHSLGEAGCCFGDRIRQTLRQSGEPPAWLDRNLLEADRERLELLYQREGYRSAVIETRIDTLSPLVEVGVTFLIRPGPATYLRTVTYDGIDHLSSAQRRKIVEESLIDHETDTTEQTTEVRAASERFSEALLLRERRRLVSLLRNDGYARITRDSIRAFVSPASADSFDVRIQINTGRRYRFGAVSLTVQGPEDAPARRDTLVEPEDQTGGVVAVLSDERRLDPTALLRNLHFRPGQWFSQSQLLTTRRRMEGTGVFSFTDFVPLWSRSYPAENDTAGSYVLPYELQFQTRRRHQLRVESFVLQRSLVLGDETGGGEVGVGIGSSYRNVNLFGGGEAFQLRTAGSVAADFETFDPFQTAQAEVELSLTYPYLFRPFRGLDRRLGLYDSRSRVSASWLTARRESIFLTIRGRASLLASVEMQHTETLTSIIRLIDFELSDPDTLSGFEDQFLSPIEDVVERERILEDFTRPNVNNAVRYTLRSSNANLLLRNKGYIREFTAELGGNLPFVLDRFILTPDTLEGSIPGIPLFTASGSGTSRLVYRQYTRFLLDLRNYHSLAAGTTVIAWKAFGGVAHPIGKSDVVPFDRRFYSGGPSSVRGWGLRDLGPGALSESDSLITGGDVKLEFGVEARNTLLSDLMEADWISALFVDIGNTWYGPRNPGRDEGQFHLDRFAEQFGVGGGFGLRVAWDYLIVRLDLAFRVHEPGQGFFKDGNPRFHFGIGHAF